MNGFGVITSCRLIFYVNRSALGIQNQGLSVEEVLTAISVNFFLNYDRGGKKIYIGVSGFIYFCSFDRKFPRPGREDKLNFSFATRFIDFLA